MWHRLCVVTSPVTITLCVQIRLPDGSSRGCLAKTWEMAQAILSEEHKRDARASSSLPSHSPSSADEVPHVQAHVSSAAAALAEDGANPANAAERPSSAGTGQASGTTGLTRGFGWDDSISTPSPSEDTLAAGIRLRGQNGARTVHGLSDEERAAATEVKQQLCWQYPYTGLLCPSVSNISVPCRTSMRI